MLKPTRQEHLTKRKERSKKKDKIYVVIIFISLQKYISKNNEDHFYFVKLINYVGKVYPVISRYFSIASIKSCFLVPLAFRFFSLQ
jgi:hypothetical protein